MGVMERVSGQVRTELFLPAGRLFPTREPVHFLELHAVLVLQDATLPDGRGHLVLGDADPLACKVAGFLDAGAGMDVDPGMPEGAGGEHGNRHEPRGSLVLRHQVGPHGHLGGVEILVAQHAPEGFLHAERQVGQVDPFHGHTALLQGACPVIVPAGDGDANIGHGGSVLHFVGCRGHGSRRGRASSPSRNSPAK